MVTGHTVVIGDLHLPWAKRPAVEKALDVCEGAGLIVQIGDLYDRYNFGRFPRSLNVMTPGEEVRCGREQAEDFWRRARARARKGARKFQLKGNHDDRIDKRIAERLPELAGLFAEQFEFEGVTTIHDSAEELVDRGIVFMHGHRARLGDHAAWNQQSTVCGHSHVGGVVWFRNARGLFYELNAGWLGDENAPPFRYRSQRRAGQRWTLGAGVIDQLGPRFVPFA